MNCALAFGPHSGREKPMLLRRMVFSGRNAKGGLSTHHLIDNIDHHRQNQDTRASQTQNRPSEWDKLQ
jgi:hypothetical protein